MNEIQPFLHVVFIDEDVIFGAEELVQVKFAELSLLCDFSDFFGQLIGQHHHFRQGEIRVLALTVVSSTEST